VLGGLLGRESPFVLLDGAQGKVSARSARDAYGVAVVAGEDGEPGHDAAATAALRTRLRAERGPLAFFDRGPGYRQLAGRDHAEVDVIEPAAPPPAERRKA